MTLSTTDMSARFATTSILALIDHDSPQSIEDLATAM
jgi:hypothetical protein